MVGTVTLGIDRYNALYKRALQADALEKENAELREKLSNATDVSYEMVDGSVLRGDTKLNDEKCLYEYKVKNEEEKCIGMIAKPIKGLKLRSGKHYAKGGLTTKGETW